MVIGLKRAGWSIRQIAADTHLGASTVHRLWRRWLEQGNVAIYRNAGATRVTSARVDRRILRQAVAAPQATCTAILQHVQDTLDHSISTRTISRRLVANGLHSCRPLRRLPLTPPNRRQRLEWCRARSTWMTEWHRVVFSDESRFCLSSDSRRVRVWRRRGERSNPAAIVERPTVRQRGIMVWGAIAYDSRSPLLRIQGTMTAQRYVDDVLRPVTLPYLQGVPNALYQQDNARPHTARISQQALQDKMMQLEDSCWAYARHEAFITLRDGVKLSQIPARLDVKAKGVVTHVYVTYGIKCYLCCNQGHKRANYPCNTGLQEDKLVLPVDAPAARTQGWTRPPSTPNAPPVAAAPQAATVVADPPPSDTVRSEEEVVLTPPTPENQSESLPESSQERRFLAENQMDDLLKNKKTSEAIARAQKLGLEREELLQALKHIEKMDRLIGQSNNDQREAIANLARALMALTGGMSKRCRQLQIIAALAREEGAWILGDLNISEESAKDLASGSAEALAELLDQADLGDVATFFDAVLEHTRVATIGSRVDARRLDRILLPSGFCDRVIQYQTLNYAYSDHHAVLIQVGDPAPKRLPCIGKLLRSDLFSDRMTAFIDEISEDLANTSPAMVREHWTRIKAETVADNDHSHRVRRLIHRESKPLPEAETGGRHWPLRLSFRLQKSGLSTRRPLLRLPLTQNHRHLRRQWCDERRMWAAEWNEIAFTDESRYCLQHHDGRIRVRKHRGERMLNSCVMNRHIGPAPGIM
ncbi:hypothetical protein LAZ67_17000028, partial [Cordylochernes scorpioides]